MSVKNSVPVLAILTTFSLAAAEAPKSWTPELSMKVQSVGDVTPSPDGRWVVWAQTHAVMETEKSESATQLFLARSDGSDRIQLTSGEKSSTRPRFAPDGRSIFFSSERGGKAAVYRIAVDGGEAERVTDFKGSIASYEISPDGKWIAFTGRETDADEERAKKEKRDFRVIDESPKNAGLWITPVEPGANGKREIRPLAAGERHIGGMDWSPDSRRIAFESRPTPEADLARKSDVFEVDVETGNVRTIAATGATEAQPRYSPDGRYLAFTRSTDPPSSVTGQRIVLYARQTGQARDLPATYDESPFLVGWAKDSRSIFFIEPKGTKVAVYAMPVDGPAKIFYLPRKGTVGFGVHLNDSGTHMGLARQAPDEPVEAYVLAVGGGEPVRVSAANTELSKPPLGETRVVRWKSKDGKEVEGVLTLPVGYQQGKKVPLILNIHGGPSGAFSETFIGAAGLYPIASFAAKGYAVLQPNPRGSVAYGLAFRAANLNDWGGGDYNDLMSGVDSLIAQGIADPNKLVVMGWSYGGYMTNWVITQTDRFKVAATGAGLSDMPSMWGTNDIPSVLDDYFSGPWYEQPERYVKLSPLYHVKNVTTPTLFLHGEADDRVPTSQGYEMYNALKRKGVETQMVVYPRQPHGPREPKFVLDIMQRHIDWVEKHLGG
jgi:dipeptidyl aminopeptidase/acylaminoacyl peptidase